MAINRVVLVGRLTRDPELRRTTSDTPVVSFTLAIDGRPRHDGTPTPTSFIGCTAWSATATNVSKFCHKGSLVAVDGRLNQRTYNAKDGHKVSVVEVVAEQVQFLETKKEAALKSDSGSETPTPSGDNNSNSTNKADEPVEGIDSSDDDLPF